jgi:hypothetical protein
MWNILPYFMLTPYLKSFAQVDKFFSSILHYRVSVVQVFFRVVTIIFYFNYKNYANITQVFNKKKSSL